MPARLTVAATLTLAGNKGTAFVAEPWKITVGSVIFLSSQSANPGAPERATGGLLETIVTSSRTALEARSASIPPTAPEGM